MSRRGQGWRATLKRALSGEKVTPNVFIIRAGKTKYGPCKHWREWEYAQYAIVILHGAHPPKNIDRSKLTREVNDWLDRNPDYRSTGLGKISRKTVLRVLALMLKSSGKQNRRLPHLSQLHSQLNRHLLHLSQLHR